MLWGFLPKKHRRAFWARSDDEIADHVLEMPETCVLDVTDKGEQTLDGVGEILGITREFVRQIVEFRGGGAIPRLRKGNKAKLLREFAAT